MITYLLIGVAQTACLMQTEHYSKIFYIIKPNQKLVVPAWLLKLAIIISLVLVWPGIAFDIFFSTAFKDY